MKLEQLPLLFLDCQTTGMRPGKSHMLELAWSLASAKEEPLAIESHLIRLPEGLELPKKISELTGIQGEELKAANDLAAVFVEFKKTLDRAPLPLTAMIHYAQFERPFLADLFLRCARQSELPFAILCSHQLIKRLLPALPSPNIRGAAGYFGAPIGGIKRAASHVQATVQIWRGLCAELEKRKIEDLSSLQDWLLETPRPKASRYEFRLDKFKRLELPDSPGVYRMLSKSGEVLYVGKATSLKSRVNSYFRGKKGRDQRKLEMLAQVWDLKVTDCKTALEAALLESDEIKRLNPPYNLVLKRGRRHIVFYDKIFNSSASGQSLAHPLGPFRNSNWMEHLRALFRSLQQTEFEQIFFTPIKSEDLRKGFALFCTLYALNPLSIRGVRSLLAKGLWLLKNHVEVEAEAEPEAETPEVELSIEEIAAKFERLLRRSAAEYLKTKTLTQMLNSEIILDTSSGPRRLFFKRGALASDGEPTRSASVFPWEGLGLDDYDRMSILLSELNKYEYQVEFST